MTDYRRPCKRASFDPLWCSTHSAAFADDKRVCSLMERPPLLTHDTKEGTRR